MHFKKIIGRQEWEQKCSDVTFSISLCCYNRALIEARILSVLSVRNDTF